MNYVFNDTKELSYGMDIAFQGDFGSHYKFNNEWQLVNQILKYLFYIDMMFTNFYNKYF